MAPSSEILTFPLGDFVTQAGATIPSAFLAYRTFGSPSNPAILYPTWYSGAILDNEWLISTSHTGLNPDKYFIIIPAMLGNGQSSSPSNSGLGVDFPATTMFDNVAAQYKLVTELFKIKTLFAVTGWSMGAGQSYQWAVSYPEMVERIIPFCGAARTAHHNITFLRSLILTLQLDPKFLGGKYAPNDQPQAGKRAFGAIYSTQGFSQAYYRAELFKEAGYPTLEAFLVGYWEDLFAHKDANDLIHMLRTWINADITCTPGRPFTHDASKGRSETGAYQAALASIKAKCLTMPGQTDLYFPPEDSMFEVANIGSNARLDIIPSIRGHFAGGPPIAGYNVDCEYIDKSITAFFKE